MTDILLNKPVSFLTVGELVGILKSELKSDPITEKPKDDRPIRGIHGLAKELGISVVKAQELKNSGDIPYSQFGRIILFDREDLKKALSLIGKPKHRK